MSQFLLRLRISFNIFTIEITRWAYITPSASSKFDIWHSSSSSIQRPDIYIEKTFVVLLPKGPKSISPFLFIRFEQGYALVFINKANVIQLELSFRCKITKRLNVCSINVKGHKPIYLPLLIWIECFRGYLELIELINFYGFVLILIKLSLSIDKN